MLKYFLLGIYTRNRVEITQLIGFWGKVVYNEKSEAQVKII